jgi:hypothetical protein
VTKADAQKVLEIISGDKAKTQTYCDIIKLGDEAEKTIRPQRLCPLLE